LSQKSKNFLRLATFQEVENETNGRPPNTSDAVNTQAIAG
jgi:hypothetical protein